MVTWHHLTSEDNLPSLTLVWHLKLLQTSSKCFICPKEKRDNGRSDPLWSFFVCPQLLNRLIASPRWVVICLKASSIAPFPSSSGAKRLLKWQNSQSRHDKQGWGGLCASVQQEAARPSSDSILEIRPVWSLCSYECSHLHITHEHTTTVCVLRGLLGACTLFSNTHLNTSRQDEKCML